jgi:hypothetical protein
MAISLEEKRKRAREFMRDMRKDRKQQDEIMKNWRAKNPEGAKHQDEIRERGWLQNGDKGNFIHPAKKEHEQDHWG